MTGTTLTAASSSAELRSDGDGSYGYSGEKAWEREGKDALAHRESTRRLDDRFSSSSLANRRRQRPAFRGRRRWHGGDAVPLSSWSWARKKRRTPAVRLGLTEEQMDAGSRDGSSGTSAVVLGREGKEASELLEGENWWLGFAGTGEGARGRSYRRRGAGGWATRRRSSACRRGRATTRGRREMRLGGLGRSGQLGQCTGKLSGLFHFLIYCFSLFI
jgi:hypothetical protein